MTKMAILLDITSTIDYDIFREYSRILLLHFEDTKSSAKESTTNQRKIIEEFEMKLRMVGTGSISSQNIHFDNSIPFPSNPMKFSEYLGNFIGEHLDRLVSTPEMRIPSEFFTSQIDFFVPTKLSSCLFLFVLVLCGLLKSISPYVQFRIYSNDRIWHLPILSLDLTTFDYKKGFITLNRDETVCFEVIYALDQIYENWVIRDVVEFIIEAKADPPISYGNLWNFLGRKRGKTNKKRSIQTIGYLVRDFRDTLVEHGFIDSIGKKGRMSRLSESGLLFWKLFKVIWESKGLSKSFRDFKEEHKFVINCVNSHLKTLEK